MPQARIQKPKREGGFGKPLQAEPQAEKASPPAPKTFTVGIESPKFEPISFSFFGNLEMFSNTLARAGGNREVVEYLSKLDPERIRSIKTSTDNGETITLFAEIPRVGAKNDSIIEIISKGGTSASIWKGGEFFAHMEQQKGRILVQRG